MGLILSTTTVLQVKHTIHTMSLPITAIKVKRITHITGIHKVIGIHIAITTTICGTDKL